MLYYRFLDKLLCLFAITSSWVAKVTRETCLALRKELCEVVMSEPKEEMWEAIADDFWEKMQFSICIGALDSKHIMLKKPSQSVSLYFNYKK